MKGFIKRLFAGQRQPLVGAAKGMAERTVILTGAAPTKDHAGATITRRGVPSPIRTTVRPATPTDSSRWADPLAPATGSPFNSALSYAFGSPEPERVHCSPHVVHDIASNVSAASDYGCSSPPSFD
jgi:hypothetical protein